MNSRPKAVLPGDLSMLRSFVGMDVETVIISQYPGDATHHSRYCSAWHLLDSGQGRDEADVVNKLIEIASSEATSPVLYYGDDAMLLLISRNRERLQEHYRFNMPSREIVEACTCKKDFEILAQEKGLPIPRGLRSSSALDCETIEKEIGFPCVFKPGSHVGWEISDAVKSAANATQKVLFANDQLECMTALKSMKNFTDDFIVQEYIPGGEDQIYSFHTYIPRGSMGRTSYIGKKIRTYPSVGGVSSYLELVDAPEVQSLGFDIIEKLEITGPVKIDFKKDTRTNRYFVLEINLRFNLWNYLGTRCGINLPYMAYMDSCSFEYAPSREYQTGVRWLDFGMDFRAFIRDYYPSGQLSLLSWLRSFLCPKVYAIFAWNDPLPYIVHNARYTSSFIRNIAGKNR